METDRTRDSAAHLAAIDESCRERLDAVEDVVMKEKFDLWAPLTFFMNHQGTSTPSARVTENYIRFRCITARVVYCDAHFSLWVHWRSTGAFPDNP